MEVPQGPRRARLRLQRVVTDWNIPAETQSRNQAKTWSPEGLGRERSQALLDGLAHRVTKRPSEARAVEQIGGPAG